MIYVFDHDDVARELKSSRITKDRQAVYNIIAKIKENINPFGFNVDKNYLFNIITGRSVSDSTCKFLIEAERIGENKKMNFISNCNSNGDSFESPIIKVKTQTFSSECLKKSFKNNDGNKKFLMKMERNIFERLLAIALGRKLILKCAFLFH